MTGSQHWGRNPVATPYNSVLCSAKVLVRPQQYEQVWGYISAEFFLCDDRNLRLCENSVIHNIHPPGSDFLIDSSSTHEHELLAHLLKQGSKEYRLGRIEDRTIAMRIVHSFPSSICALQMTLI